VWFALMLSLELDFANFFDLLFRPDSKIVIVGNEKPQLT